MLLHRSSRPARVSVPLLLGMVFALLIGLVFPPAASLAAGANPGKLEATTSAHWVSIIDSYLDSSNNLYVTGTYSGTLDFDTGPGTSTLGTNPASSLGDIFIAKYTAQGELTWVKQLRSQQNVYAQYSSAIIADASGNVYVTGSFYGTMDFDPGAGTTNLSAQSGNTDAFVLKLDSSGAFSWAFDIGGSTSDSGSALALDSSGNLYVVGDYYGSGVDADPGAGTITLPGVASGKHLFVLKVNTAAGSVTWARAATNPGGYDPAATDVVVDGNGMIYVAGTMIILTVDPAGANIGLTSGYPANYNDGFLWKLNNSGTTQSAIKIGGYAANGDGIDSLALDSSNNLYLAGYFNGDADFDPGAGTVSRTAASNGSAFLLKLTSAGAFSMVQTWSGDNPANYDGIGLTNIAIDSSGNLLLAGSLSGSVDLDPGAGTTTFTGSYDGLLLKLSSAGAFILARQVATSAALVAALPLSNDDIMVIGNVAGDVAPRSVDVDPGSGSATVSVPANYSDDINFIYLYPTSAFFTTWKFDGSGLGNPPGGNVAPTFDDADNQATLTLLEDAVPQDLRSLLAASDSDASQTLTWSQVGAPAKGVFSITSGTANTPASAALPQSASYTPNANANGTDSFGVKVSDGSGSDTLTFSVAITAVNDEPALTLAPTRLLTAPTKAA